MSKNKKLKTPQQLWECFSSILVEFVERVFFTLGVKVARHPWRTIILIWIFVLLSSIGMMKFHLEKNPMKLWVPPDSDFLHDTNWYIDTFGTGFRLQRVILTKDNVLEPEVFQEIYNISNQVNSISVTYNNTNYSLSDFCFQVPVISVFGSDVSDLQGNNSEYSDTALWVDELFYCSLLENFKKVCLQYNILDIWENKFEIINNLTQREIIKKINEVKKNPVNHHPLDFSKLLGNVEYDDEGRIVSAKSIILTWYSQVNMSAVDLNVVGNLVGTEEWVSVPLALWEGEFLNLMEKLLQNITSMELFYEAGRSFGDVSGQAMFNDMDKLFVGILLMFLYVQLSLSRFNWLEIKLTLGGVGLLAIGMAYITSVSWCSILDIPFGPVHSSLPFLLMGLGIDDMFVMGACWDNLTEDEKKKSLPFKVGLMLKHAGVSIVITSFTDIVALLIGAITILPSLRSFCIYAAMGVFFIFCFSVTFYVAFFTLDLKRIESNRNGVIFCYTHKKQIKTKSGTSACQKLFAQFYKNVIFTVPGKVFVILFTIAMTGFSIDAVLRLQQRFDPKWFIPDDTYYKHFLDAHETYYPDEGNMAMVFIGKMNYSHDINPLLDMVHVLRSKPYLYNVNNWVEPLIGYVNKNFDRDLRNTTSFTDNEFRYYLSKFLFSSIGGRYQINFKFSEPLQCGKPAPTIDATTILFNFVRFKGPEEYIPAMNDAKATVKYLNVSHNVYRSVWSKAFSTWVTDEIIAVEVERNIELALLCVMLCTVVLITNLQMCMWIFICVLMTILYVLGCMQRWGMTVDIVCCIGLELAIGLCVDYAAHVGHTFLTVSEGNRSERALKTVTSIGTAVLLGGGGTFLALSLLITSKAYTFQSFFKIFFLVITFGLFNGLVFLPVILSLIGPDPYKAIVVETNKDFILETVELNGKQNLESNKIKADCG